MLNAFQMSSTSKANPLDVEDYLDCFEDVSNELLEHIVNMSDNSVSLYFVFKIETQIKTSRKLFCLGQHSNALCRIARQFRRRVDPAGL